MSLSALVSANDFAGIASNLSDRFNEDISEQLVRNICEDRNVGRNDWSEGTLTSWFKIQLHDYGLFDGKGKPEPNMKFVTPLHIGAVTLEETPEMLARLQDDDWSEPEFILSALDYEDEG